MTKAFSSQEGRRNNNNKWQGNRGRFQRWRSKSSRNYYYQVTNSPDADGEEPGDDYEEHIDEEADYVDTRYTREEVYEAYEKYLGAQDSRGWDDFPVEDSAWEDQPDLYDFIARRHESKHREQTRSELSEIRSALRDLYAQQQKMEQMQAHILTFLKQESLKCATTVPFAPPPNVHIEPRKVEPVASTSKQPESLRPENPPLKSVAGCVGLVCNGDKQPVSHFVRVLSGALINKHVIKDAVYLRFGDKCVRIPSGTRQFDLAEDLVWCDCQIPGMPAVSLSNLKIPVVGLRIGIQDSVNNILSTSTVNGLTEEDLQHGLSTTSGSCGAPIVSETGVVGFHRADGLACRVTEKMMLFFRGAAGGNGPALGKREAAHPHRKWSHRK
jgi:hypothetical protein